MVSPPAASSNNRLFDWAKKMAAATAAYVSAPIANASLADMLQATFKGRASGAGTGPPQDLTGTQATAILDVFTALAKGLVPASGGGTTNFLRADATFAAPPSAAVAGMIIQVAQTTYTTNANLSTAIPDDDTVPTSTEGTQVLSQAITPAATANKVKCTVVIHGEYSTGQTSVATVLFRGTTAIAAAYSDINSISNTTGLDAHFAHTIVFLDSPASVSAQTYSVRVGQSGGSCRLNGNLAGRKLGGVAVCTLTVEEVKG